MLEESVQVVRVRVHVIAGPWLTGPPMTSTIMRNDSIALLAQEEHLVLPIVSIEWPAIGENDGLAGRVSPALVEDLGVVFFGYEASGLKS